MTRNTCKRALSSHLLDLVEDVDAIIGQVFRLSIADPRDTKQQLSRQSQAHWECLLVISLIHYRSCMPLLSAILVERHPRLSRTHRLS